LLGDALHLEDHFPGPHHRHPPLRSAFPLAHARLGRLFGDGLVREDPNPYLAAALHETGHGDPSRLYLLVGDPAALHDLQADVSVRTISAPPSRPEHLVRTPLAPKRRADSMAFFIARRNATRRSICRATDSATSWATTSGLWISTILMKISRPVRLASSSRSL